MKTMKKFTVNVHYDVCLTVEVEAENEQEALELAEKEAAMCSLNDSTCESIIGKCITDVEEI